MLYLFQMSQELSKILKEHLNRGNLCKSRTQSFTQLLVAKATFLYSVRWNGWKFFYLKFQKILKFFQLFLISYRTNHFLSNQSLRGRCQNHVTQSTVTNHLISDIISKWSRICKIFLFFSTTHLFSSRRHKWHTFLLSRVKRKEKKFFNSNFNKILKFSLLSLIFYPTNHFLPNQSQWKEYAKITGLKKALSQVTGLLARTYIIQLVNILFHNSTFLFSTTHHFSSGRRRRHIWIWQLSCPLLSAYYILKFPWLGMQSHAVWLGIIFWRRSHSTKRVEFIYKHGCLEKFGWPYFFWIFFFYKIM